MKGSWKTTLAGILTLVAAGLTLVVVPILDADPATSPKWAEFLALLAPGLGLLMARDNDKSSEDVGAK